MIESQKIYEHINYNNILDDHVNRTAENSPTAPVGESSKKD